MAGRLERKSETIPERVLLVYKHYAPDTGGIETAIKQYAQWYRALGWEVRVLCCAVSRSSTRREVVDGIQVLRCGTWGNIKSVPMSPAFFWHYWRETRQADLVHINLQFPWASMGYWLFGWARSCRWLVSYHMDVHRQKWLKRLTYPFDRYLLRRADSVMTSSPAMRDSSEVLSTLGRSIAILPYTLERFDPTPYRGDVMLTPSEEGLSDPGYFLFFGRLVEYKGTRPLVAAIRCCASERPDIRFVIFGRGPERLPFERLAADHPEQVTYIPEFVSEVRKYRLIQRASAILFPSVYPLGSFWHRSARSHGVWQAPDQLSAEYRRQLGSTRWRMRSDGASR